MKNINVQAIVSQIESSLIPRIAAHVSAVGQEMVKEAKRRAPVGSEKKGESIVLRKEASLREGFTNTSVYDVKNRKLSFNRVPFTVESQSQIRNKFVGKKYPVAVYQSIMEEHSKLRAEAFQKSAKYGTAAFGGRAGLSKTDVSKEIAHVFRFKSGGGQPVSVGISKSGSLVGFREHGKLRDSIAFEGPIIVGNEIHAQLVARVPYAKSIEYGWNGETPTGGQYNVRAQPYLWPAFKLHEEKLKKFK